MRLLIRFFLLLCFAFSIIPAAFAQKADPANVPGNEPAWWKEAVVYQLYPRSFKDSDGDGIGDLRGIISKLDYLKSLGIDAIWLNPIYSSPNDDNGYDVSDYRSIMKEFGTMADFEELIQGLHQRGIRLIMDLVVNHSSDEHEWFKQSRSSRTSPYRDYYHWWPAENGKPPYRYSLFDINHDAWMYDSVTNAYYLHYFSRKQPDLKWENPKLRQEVYDIMKFWAAKGTDGFRMDAFQFCAKDTTYPIFPDGYEKNFVKYYAMQGNIHGYLREMNQAVLTPLNLMSVAEGAGNTLEDAHNLVDANRRELSMAYAFEAIDLARHGGYDFIKLKNIFAKWDSAFARNGWLSVFLASHDQARMVSRFGNDAPAYRTYSIKLLNTLLLTMRGTPYIYNGDELGMTNAGFRSIDEIKDMPTLNEYQYIKNHGGDLAAFMKRTCFETRDNGRTPFQWDETTHAGFTTGTPWLRTALNYKEINARAQENDPGSSLNYFRSLIQLRKKHRTLVYGAFTLLERNHPQLFAYTREDAEGKFLIVLNFSDREASTGTLIPKDAVRITGNYSGVAGSNSIRAYESAIYRLR